MSIVTASRYVAVVADGSTDKEILGAVARTMLYDGGPVDTLALSQSIGVYVQRFIRITSATGDFASSGRAAQELRRGIVTVLHAAVSEFQDCAMRELRGCDLLILNSDAERHLSRGDQYFEEEWALCIARICLTATEDFYNTGPSKSRWEYLPLILPVVLFPSTDILVAAAKVGHEAFAFRGSSAREIKYNLYGVYDLRALRDEEFEEKALRPITREACRGMYEHVPETRLLLHTLLWALR